MRTVNDYNNILGRKIEMMHSTKVDQSRIIGKNPFSNSLTPYQNYLSLLQSNTNCLKQRFPLEERDKIKSLLEQLDNSVQMVADLLKEESAKQIIIRKLNLDPKLSIEQQNKILKKAFLRVYKESLQTERLCKELAEKCEKLKKDNAQLANYNRLLIDRDFQKNQEQNNPDVY